ncbi:MAG: hypothetical protein ACXVE4_11325 [Solirubrobacteraceae bacterium]
MTTPTVASIRASLGEGREGDSIRRLAQLSDMESPESAVVLAEVCGEPVAAVGTADGRAVADPAHSTTALQRHLQLHSVKVRLIGSVWGT